MASTSSIPLASLAPLGHIADQVRLKLLPEYDGTTLFSMWKVQLAFRFNVL
jgi:hypothetical protein